MIVAIILGSFGLGALVGSSVRKSKPTKYSPSKDYTTIKVVDTTYAGSGGGYQIQTNGAHWRLLPFGDAYAQNKIEGMALKEMTRLASTTKTVEEIEQNYRESLEKEFVLVSRKELETDAR